MQQIACVSGPSNADYKDSAATRLACKSQALFMQDAQETPNCDLNSRLSTRGLTRIRRPRKICRKLSYMQLAACPSARQLLQAQTLKLLQRKSMDSVADQLNDVSLQGEFSSTLVLPGAVDYLAADQPYSLDWPPSTATLLSTCKRTEPSLSTVSPALDFALMPMIKPPTLINNPLVYMRAVC